MRLHGESPAKLLEPGFNLRGARAEPGLGGPAERGHVEAHGLGQPVRVERLRRLGDESLGLGACYMTGPLLAARELAKLAGLKPGREPGALIPLGYKA